MSATAYGLVEELQGTDDAGEPKWNTTFGLADGRQINVAEELEKGGGAIVVPEEDYRLRDVLEGCPALTSVSAPADAQASGGYEDLTVPQLKELVAERGLEVPSDAKKDDLVAALEGRDAASAAGLQNLTVEELKELAKERSVEVASDATKDELVAALEGGKQS